MKSTLYVWIFIVALNIINCDRVRKFDEHTVFRVLPTSEFQLNALHELAINESYYYPERKLDFWRRPRFIGEYVDVMVDPNIREEIKSTFSLLNLEPSVLINDVEKLVSKERESMALTKLLYQSDSWISDPISFFKDYRQLDEIHAYLDYLGSAYSEFAAVETIGKSFEGKDLKLIKIGFPDQNMAKTSIWIDAGIHAREWIAPMTAMFLIHKLTREVDNPEVQDLLKKFDFYILPSSNPDGFVYTQQDRMWRKTRSKSGSFFDFVCNGVDPNRNWGFHWNEAGASTNPCSDIYAGPRAFSESETKAMSDFIYNIKDTTAMYLSLHSYSQLILTPWGWTKDLPDDYPDLEKRGLHAKAAIKANSGKIYNVGSSTRVLYSAAGGSDDWAYSVGIKYAYTFELRDTGNKGFLLPKEEIIDCGNEIWEALKVISLGIAAERGIGSI